MQWYESEYEECVCINSRKYTAIAFHPLFLPRNVLRCIVRLWKKLLSGTEVRGVFLTKLD